MKHFVNKFILKKMFDKKDDYNKVMHLITNDCVKFGMVSLMLIMIFEVVMVALWNSGNDFDNLVSIMYFVSYVFLLVLSMVQFLVLYNANRTGKYIEKKVIFSAYFYTFVLLIWSLMITYLDISKSGHFSSMVYMTIIIIIPVSVFIEPLYYLILNILGSSAVVSFLLIYCDLSKNRGNLINFLIYAIISMVAGCAYLMVRMNGYANRVKLENANIKLQYASEHDYLSGLYNRQKLGILSETIWNSCVERNEQLSCVLCDLDNFKKVNDEYGHDCGDACIRLVADVFREELEDTGAYFFRYGGEEFLLLFPNKGYEDTYKSMEKIQTRLKRVGLNLSGTDACITMSVGIYTDIPDDNHLIKQYFTKADLYMYEAKTNGKDCIKGENTV